MTISQKSVGLVIGLILAAMLISGCTQFPTEKQNVTDMRPQLSFKVLDDSLFGARIYVDGLDMGVVEDYLEGAASLRVLPGNHQIRIDRQGRTIVDEKLYMGDGVNRTILVK